jgi:hypothetical protein
MCQLNLGWIPWKEFVIQDLDHYAIAFGGTDGEKNSF